MANFPQTPFSAFFGPKTDILSKTGKPGNPNLVHYEVKKDYWSLLKVYLKFGGVYSEGKKVWNDFIKLGSIFCQIFEKTLKYP